MPAQGLFALLGGSPNLAADPGPRQVKQMGGSINGSPTWFMMEHPMKSYEYDLIYIYMDDLGVPAFEETYKWDLASKRWDVTDKTRQDTMHPYFIRTSIRKYVHTDRQTYRHTSIHPCIHPYRQTDKQTGMRTCMHPYVHTYIRTCIHVYIRTYIQNQHRLG